MEMPLSVACAACRTSCLSSLRFRNLTVKNRIFRSNISGPLRQLRRLRQPGAHQLGDEVRARRRRRDRVVVRAGARSAAASCRTTRRSIATSGFRSGGRSARRVHQYDCRFILQLSHGGRQRDMPGIEYPDRTELHRASADPLHGFECKAMTVDADHARRSTRSPKARGARARRGSTASSCTAPTATSLRSSSARRSTIATTNTAARSKTAPGSCIDIVKAIRRKVGQRLPPPDEDQRRGAQQRAASL